MSLKRKTIAKRNFRSLEPHSYLFWIKSDSRLTAPSPLPQFPSSPLQCRMHVTFAIRIWFPYNGHQSIGIDEAYLSFFERTPITLLDQTLFTLFWSGGNWGGLPTFLGRGAPHFVYPLQLLQVWSDFRDRYGIRKVRMQCIFHSLDPFVYLSWIKSELLAPAPSPPQFPSSPVPHFPSSPLARKPMDLREFWSDFREEPRKRCPRMGSKTCTIHIFE